MKTLCTGILLLAFCIAVFLDTSDAWFWRRTCRHNKPRCTNGRSLSYVNVVERTGGCGRQVDVTIRVKCAKPWIFDRKGRPSDSELNMLCRLLKDGISHFWSQSIQRGGQTWQVNVKVENAGCDDSYKTVVLKHYSSRPTGLFESERSHNTGIVRMVVKYLAYRSDADNDFKRTAAHEIGHSILEKARGRTYSWTHKGTSTMFTQRPNGSPCPSTGPIDLMKYWTTGCSNRYARSEAVEADILLLLRIACTTSRTTC